jgi:hypothetical protein
MSVTRQRTRGPSALPGTDRVIHHGNWSSGTHHARSRKGWRRNAAYQQAAFEIVGHDTAAQPMPRARGAIRLHVGST